MKKIKKQEIKYELPSNRSISTSLAIIFAGFAIFFLLISGSLTDNRFGTHLVFDPNLTSSPQWFINIVSALSISFIIVGFITLIMSKISRGNLWKPEQQRVIRAGTIFTIAIAAVVAGLSSTIFAAFNNDFFFGPKIDIGGVNIPVQSFTIASLALGGIFLTLLITGIFAIREKGIKRKTYTSVRNSGLIVAAAGWAIFIINLMAFGSLGGDANVLVTGLFASHGKDVDLATWASENPNTLSDAIHKITSKEFADFWTPIIVNILPKPIPNRIIHKQLVALWEGNRGLSITIWKILNKISDNLGDTIWGAGGLQALFISKFSSLVAWLSILDKPSMLEGVNQSFNAYMILTLLIAFVAIGPIYGVIDYRNSNSDGNTICYRIAMYILISTTLVFLFMSLVIPYIPGGEADLENYSPLNALISGKGAGIAPGLIAPSSMEGGIHTALVYFSPNYHGTITWYIFLGVVIAIPFISLSIELIFKTRNKFKFP